MLIAEELLLLSIDDETGKRVLGTDQLDPALGGALLVELALMERIAVSPATDSWTQRGRVSITSTTPTDDPELDALLQRLQDREGAKVKDLVSQASFKPVTKGLRERLLARLMTDGVLEEQRSDIFRIRTWPTADHGPEDEVRSRLQAALVGGQAPAERTAALIALLSASGLLTKVVVTSDKKALKERAKQLSEGDWAARAVKDAIDEVAAVTAAVAVAAATGGSGGS